MDVNYTYEQRGRRAIVAVAVVLGLGMVALGLAYGAPWYFIAIPGIPALMALAVLVQNSQSGLRLEGNTLILFKDEWSHVIDVRAIRGVRITRWSDGQPSVWLDLVNAPAYRLPGYCFGSSQQLIDAFRQRGIPVT